MMKGGFNSDAFKNWFLFIFNEVSKSIAWGKKKQAETMNTIAMLLKNNVYLNEAAKLLVEHGSEKEKVIGAKIERYLEDGKTISEALQEDLSLSAYQALNAGVKANDVEAGLENAVDSLKLSNAMGLPLLWYLFKPIFWLTAACAGMALFSTTIVPIITETVDRETLPSIALYVDSLGGVFADYGAVVLMLVLAIITVSIVSLPVLTGDLRKKLDDYPIYKQYRVLVSTSLLQSLSNLAKSNVDLNNSLESTVSVSSPYVAFHLNSMIETLGSGEDNIGEILDSGLLMDEQVKVLKTLGTRSGTSEILESSAEIHKQRLLTTVDKLKVYGESIIKSVAYSLMLATFVAIILSVLSIQSQIQY